MSSLKGINYFFKIFKNQDFVKFHLPNQNKFNFKIYTLKQNVRDSYLANKFNFTYFFDPQNPNGNIYWYQSEEENFEKQRNDTQNNCKNFKRN